MTKEPFLTPQTVAEQDSLIEFPCDFPIKIMGETRDDFTAKMVEVIQQHLPDFMPNNIEMRASSGGKYISITATVYVTNKPQLDAIYMSLTAHEYVKVVL